MSFTKLMFQRDPGAGEGGAADAPVKDFSYGGGSPEPEPEPAAAAEPAANGADAAKPDAPAADPAKPDAAKPDAPKAEEPKPDAAKPDAPVFDWKKELKGLDRNEVLKEIGLDDFTIGLIDYKQKTGTLDEYLAVKTVDYTAMNPETLIKLDMKKANPGMSDKALEFKFKKEFEEKYYLNREDYPEDSDEAAYGQEQLRLDSEKVKKEFIENQQKFKAPEAKPDEEAVRRETAQKERVEALSKAVLSNEHTVALKTTKTLSFGEGEESFNYPVDDADTLIAHATAVIANSEEGTLDGVDLKEFYQSLAIGRNHKAFLEDYGKHQRALEHKRLQNEMHNISPLQNGTDAPPPPAKNHGYGERK